MSQFALPLGPSGDGSPRRFVVGGANRAAIEAIEQAGTWPFRTAVLMAPPRSGKSLLARWFVESGRGDAVDDADRVDETALFHRWNRAQAAGTPLLLTVLAREGDEEVAPGGNAGQDGAMPGWRIALPDLASRLGAALVLHIGAPDDAMLADLIAVHAETRGLHLAQEGLRYLASRCERSHMGAERVVATIDRLSLERKTPPGPAVWRDALEEIAGAGQPRQSRLL
jgi:chromosomal replication initiation ATPase DnaA